MDSRVNDASNHGEANPEGKKSRNDARGQQAFKISQEMNAVTEIKTSAGNHNVL